MKKTIIIQIGEKAAIYNSTTRVVSQTTENGIVISAAIPSKWDTKRIKRFMENLLKAEL